MQTTAFHLDPDLIHGGCLPAAPVLRLVEKPIRFIPIRVLAERVRPVPMLVPTREQAIDFVEQVRSSQRFGDDPCGSCDLYLWSPDDRGSYCAWGEGDDDGIEDCNGYDADRFERDQWKAIEADVEELPA